MTINFDKTRDLSKLKITKHIGEINSSKYLNNCEDNLFHLMYMIHVITLCTIICMLDKDVNKIFSGKVYNITPYMEYHPGGEEELMRGAGIDGTQLFDEVWSEKLFWKFSKLKYLCLQLSKFQKRTCWRAKMVISVLTSSGVNRSCLWYYNDLGKIFRFACCFRMYSIKKKNK